MVVIIAKASMTKDTCRCHPCQERLKAKLGFGGLEAVLDGPAMAFDGGQRFDAGPGRATMC